MPFYQEFLYLRVFVREHRLDRSIAIAICQLTHKNKIPIAPYTFKLNKLFLTISLEVKLRKEEKVAFLSK